MQEKTQEEYVRSYCRYITGEMRSENVSPRPSMHPSTGNSQSHLRNGQKDCLSDRCVIAFVAKKRVSFQPTVERCDGVKISDKLDR